MHTNVTLESCRDPLNTGPEWINDLINPVSAHAWGINPDRRADLKRGMSYSEVVYTQLVMNQHSTPDLDPRKMAALDSHIVLSERACNGRHTPSPPRRGKHS